MSVSEVNVALVRESHALAMHRPRDFAVYFYGRLQREHPFLRALFSDDMERQYRAFADTLTVIVDSLDDLAPMLPAIEELARRHVRYGVRASHYPPIGEVLVESFADILGDRFTPAMRSAWEAAFALVSAHMIATAYPDAGANP